MSVDHDVTMEYQGQVARRSARYVKHMERVKSALGSNDPRTQAAIQKANGGFTRLKTLGTADVHVDSTTSSISIQYQNGEYIGEYLMPPVPVSKKSDFYFIYDKRNRLAYPDDAIGERGTLNETTETRSKDQYSCIPRGFKNYVDGETLANQDAPLNEMIDSVESVAEGIAFRREVRIATVMTTAGNYAGNAVTLAGSSQWDNGGGDPIGVIQTAKASLFNGRNPTRLLMWSSLEVYNVLSRHPAILDLFKYGGTAPGLASASMIAKFFGCDDYLVSEARQDTANEGQTANYGRIWGKNFGLARVAIRPGIRTATFGSTFRHGPVRTDTWFDITRGREGGYWNRVSVGEDHKVVAADLGYLVASPIA